MIEERSHTSMKETSRLAGIVRWDKTEKTSLRTLYDIHIQFSGATETNQCKLGDLRP